MSPPLFVPLPPAALPPFPQGQKLGLGSAVAFSRQPGTFLRLGSRGTAAQAAGAVQGSTNREQRFSRVLGWVTGFRHDSFPKLCSGPQEPCLAGIFIVQDRHLLFNDRTHFFVPLETRSGQII